MSTNNGTSLNHSPTLTPAQGKSPTNPLVKPEVRTEESVRTRQFEQPVLLQQSPIWSRAILCVDGSNYYCDYLGLCCQN